MYVLVSCTPSLTLRPYHQQAVSQQQYKETSMLKKLQSGGKLYCGISPMQCVLPSVHVEVLLSQCLYETELLLTTSCHTCLYKQQSTHAYQ